VASQSPTEQGRPDFQGESGQVITLYITKSQTYFKRFAARTKILRQSTRRTGDAPSGYETQQKKLQRSTNYLCDVTQTSD
jgi:hypothetical protein